MPTPPQTLPAHASILSGRLPFETGVRDDVGFVIKAGERLLPQMLRERGFSTGGVVSAYVLRKESGLNQGFEFFDSAMPPPSPDGSIERVKRDGAESEAVAERWLDQQRSQRVFLFLHLERTAPALHASGTIRRVRPLRRRDCLRRRDRRATGPPFEDPATLRAIDDRAAVRPRRRPGRSW